MLCKELFDLQAAFASNETGVSTYFLENRHWLQRCYWEIIVNIALLFGLRCYQWVNLRTYKEDRSKSIRTYWFPWVFIMHDQQLNGAKPKLHERSIWFLWRRQNWLCRERRTFWLSLRMRRRGNCKNIEGGWF